MVCLRTKLLSDQDNDRQSCPLLPATDNICCIGQSFLLFVLSFKVELASTITTRTSHSLTPKNVLWDFSISTAAVSTDLRSLPPAEDYNTQRAFLL